MVPDQLVWSSAGPSGPSRYTAFNWFGQIGVDPTKTKTVITEGAADSMTKLAGRHVVLAIHSVADAKSMAEGGKIKLLGVLAPKRVSYIPSVPTAEEQGVIKGVSVSWWAGISMPAATPDAIVRKWEAALAEMVKDPAFRAAADRVWMNLDYLNAATSQRSVRLGEPRTEDTGHPRLVLGPRRERLWLPTPRTRTRRATDRGHRGDKKEARMGGKGLRFLRQIFHSCER